MKHDAQKVKVGLHECEVEWVNGDRTFGKLRTFLLPSSTRITLSRKLLIELLMDKRFPTGIDEDKLDIFVIGPYDNVLINVNDKSFVIAPREE